MSDCSNWRGDQIKAAVERQFIERDGVKTRAHELSERNSRNEYRERSLSERESGCFRVTQSAHLCEFICLK